MKIMFFALILTLVFVSIGIPLDALGYSFVAVTSKGVTFPITVSEINSSNSSGTGDSILDGLGVYLAIQNINTDGKVYFGNNLGSQTDIRQYVDVGTADWAIAITDDDVYETLSVPEFGQEYTYRSGTLVNVNESEPNILGFSTSRSMSGSNSISLNNDGITVSGTGVVVADISMMDGVSVLLTGTIDAGANLEIIQTPQDVIGVISYDTTKGYLIAQMNAALSGSNAYVNTNIELHTLDILTVETWQTSPHQHSELYQCGRGKCYRYWNHDHVSNIGAPTFTDTIDVDGNRLITRIEKSGIDVNSAYAFKIYLTDFGEKLQIFNSDFESVHEFEINSKNIYLIAEIDNNSVSIKGEAFDPQLDVFFQVDNLPENIAYDVSKSGITGVVGKTSSTGEISLLVGDVDFGVSNSPGGILKIYPNSTKHLGEFGIIMIDVLHDGTIQLPVGNDLVYVPQNYVRWVFPVPIEVENVRIDTTQLNYLNKNYTKNDALMIPVIPGASIIYATINGEDVEILMRDVSSATQIKQVPQKSSITSDHTTSGTASTSSNISTSTFLTATHKGEMSVNLDLKVGGSVEYTMDASYVGEFSKSTSCKWSGASSPYRTYSCSIYSTPANPSSISNIDSLTAEHQTQLVTSLNNGQASNLTVELDIFQNMKYVDTVLVYTSNSAQASITSTLSEAGYGASNQVHITYPLTSISDNITIPVNTGDMMEFVMRVNLDASGAPTPSSGDGAYSSYVQVTTEFGGGLITVGMS